LKKKGCFCLGIKDEEKAWKQNQSIFKLYPPIFCHNILRFLGSTTTPGGTRLFSNTLHLLKAQNIYTEMMFKYMLYRYGHKEAILRFASLIKSCIDQNIMVSGDGDLRIHDLMVKSITEETERSLRLHD
jgi:hypothetical protein